MTDNDTPPDPPWLKGIGHLEPEYVVEPVFEFDVHATGDITIVIDTWLERGELP